MERWGGRGCVSANIGDGGEMFEVGGEPKRCEVALKLRGEKKKTIDKKSACSKNSYKSLGWTQIQVCLSFRFT